MNSVVQFLGSHLALLLFGWIALQQCAFADDGFVTTDFNLQADSVKQGALLLDGKIISFGMATGVSTNGYAIGVTQHLYDGTPDSSFGAGGKVVVPNNSTYKDSPLTGVVQPDGKMVIGGMRYNSKTNSWLVVRLKANGSLDTTFNKVGYVTTSILAKSMSQAVRAVTIQPDGKILATGHSINSSGAKVGALARYNSSGTLDSTFGSSGLVKPVLNVYSWEFASAALQGNKIVAVGWCFTYTLGRDLLVMRFNTNGSLDSTFGTGGIVRTKFPEASNLFGKDVAIQPDGSILVGVEGDDDLGFWPGVVRYGLNGALDLSFGVNGLVETHLTPPIDQTYYGSMTLQADGNIVVTGTQLGPMQSSGVVLVRYLFDGSLDSDFGVDGVVVDWIGNAHDVLIDLYGKVLVFGDSENDFLVARYWSNGLPDLDF